MFSAVLYLLVLTRLWDAAASHRRALDRERVLRHAGLSLVTTADVPQVAGAVKDAVDALLGGHSQGDALLGVRIDGTLRAVDRGIDPTRGTQLGQLAESWLSLAVGTAPKLTPMGRAARPGEDGPSRCRLDAALPARRSRTGPPVNHSSA